MNSNDAIVNFSSKTLEGGLQVYNSKGVLTGATRGA